MHYDKTLSMLIFLMISVLCGLVAGSCFGNGGGTDISDGNEDSDPELPFDGEDGGIDSGDDSEEDGDNSGSACGTCVPSCQNRQCGGNGCGGLCGNCDYPEVCSLEYHGCMAIESESCQLRNCGIDETWGTNCGECPTEFHCSRICEPDQGGCVSIPNEGMCINGTLVRCIQGAMTVEYCRFRQCTVDTNTGVASCVMPDCIPDCFGKTCGNDSCGGSCGVCGAEEECNGEYGICMPRMNGCNGIPAGGICRGYSVVRCVDGELVVSACLKEGMICRLATDEQSSDCCFANVTESCGELGLAGHCENDYYYWCSNNTLRVEKCTDLGYERCDLVTPIQYGCQ